MLAFKMKIFQRIQYLILDKVGSLTYTCCLITHNPQFWLECGVDPNCKDYDMRTPLHIAYANNRTEIVALLEKYNSLDNQIGSMENLIQIEHLKPFLHYKMCSHVIMI